MSLVSQVGRKRPRARLAMGFLYLLLIVGALTTVYPFLLMVSTGLKGPTDQNDTAVIPTYVSDSNALLSKYVDDKYSGNLELIGSTRIGSAGDVTAYNQFLMTLPLDMWSAGFRLAPNQVTSRVTQRYQTWLRSRFASIEELNKTYIEENVAFQTVQPPTEQLERSTWKPLAAQRYDDWLEFKKTLPSEYRIPVRTTRLWQEFLRTSYKNRIEDVPSEQRGSAKTFESIVSKPSAPEFLNQLPERYRNGTAEELWSASHTGPMPIEAAEKQFVEGNASEIKREFAGRNFRYVLDYILINGRAVLNTFIFCGLAILTQLVVNPLAAYALSRYPIKASGKILLFLLATMAFPAEVAMIPSFLLLKDLHLLNTFAALVLPGMASGYMIFLLKGFFDSLPTELFEAGQLDGAPETTLLARIAIPLTKPVLGYLALMAFMASYSTFMFAFLVAQDQKMWTLMVWVYQLQTTAPKAVVMAALALAALPTLIVFLFAQRVIMKGIVIPGDR
ncbi:MAG: carbohydrate ABC transporter permease [Fimbriimonas sp.]|nr:carbohydrate ABC transporter permease [Fimbriimonas sp.]